MGTFGTCKNCGEPVEFVFNKNHKRVPINIVPSIQYSKYTGKYVHVRLNHFVTCGKKQKQNKEVEKCGCM